MSEPDRAFGRQRQRVLDVLRDAAGPVDAHQVAAALDIHVTTVRFHLGTLEEQGAIRRGGGTGGGVGRPRLTYVVAPRLDYADIVALFATHLGGSAAEREAVAVRVGADLARRARLVDVVASTSLTELVEGVLAALGFQIRSVATMFGSLTVRLCSCPLAELAADAPEVVRGIQQGLVQEVVDANADALGRRYRVAVRPDPRQGACEVSLELT